MSNQTHHKGETYCDCEVPLGGHIYEDCAFINCVFIFDGSLPRLQNCKTEECAFKFVGAAELTLVTLKGLWAGGNPDAINALSMVTDDVVGTIALARRSDAYSTSPLNIAPVVDQTFRKQTIEIDGQTFHDCTFEDVAFKYGGGPVSFKGCNFHGTPHFLIAGDLEISLEFLRRFYHKAGPVAVEGLISDLTAMLRQGDPIQEFVIS